MQDFLNFIITNKRLILEVAILIFSVVMFILRKKPVNDILSWIYQFSIEAVIDSENQPVYSNEKSAEKLTYAVSYVCEELKRVFPNIETSFYEPLIRKFIEDILSTPQKKGGNYGQKTKDEKKS